MFLCAMSIPGNDVFVTAAVLSKPQFFQVVCKDILCPVSIPVVADKPSPQVAGGRASEHTAEKSHGFAQDERAMSVRISFLIGTAVAVCIRVMLSPSRRS